MLAGKPYSARELRRLEKRRQQRKENDPEARRLRGKLITDLTAKEVARLDAEPQTAEQRNELILMAFQCVHAISNGTASEHDVNSLDVVMAISIGLAERGVAAEAMDEFKDGRQAVHSIIDRHARAERYVATGPELLALRAAVDLHAAALELGPSVAVIRDVLGDIKAFNSLRDFRGKAGPTSVLSSCPSAPTT